MAPKKRNRFGDLPLLKPEFVGLHLDANYDTFSDFYKKLRINEVINKLVSHSSAFEIIENPSEALCRWRDIQSIPFHAPKVDSKQLTHLIKEKPVKKPEKFPESTKVPSKLESLKFLDSKLFDYTLGIKTNVYLDGMNIRPYVEGLMSGSPRSLVDSKAKRGDASVMFCGGPVSALAICPRSDSSGKEILAVSTFAEEVQFFLPDSPATYIQFWSFSPKLDSPPECNLLLEVPKCTVLAMEWCPVLVDYSDKCFKRSSRAQKANNDCLGLLAVGTDKGVIFIYSIPRQLPDMKNVSGNGGPSIFRTTPIAALIHSIGYDVEHCIPIGSLKWSYYDGGIRLLGVSDAGGIMAWNLDSNSVEFTNNSDSMSHMRNISRVYNPVTSFCDSNWDAPPVDCCWIDENQLLVTLRSRAIYIYSWPEMETILVDTKSRSVGQSLVQMPALYDGCFCLDTSYTNVDGIAYSGINYLTHDSESIDSIPLFNRHQVQLNDAAVSPRSGLLATVGADGRLYQSLNGRISSREDDENDRVFHYGRPLIHLIRWHRELDKENPGPVSIKHEECRQNTWLELRAGDAALLDMATTRKHLHLAADALLDRRTESLTRVSASTLTEGLVAAGGEAGLVFIMPTLL